MNKKYFNIICNSYVVIADGKYEENSMLRYFDYNLKFVALDPTFKNKCLSETKVWKENLFTKNIDLAEKYLLCLNVIDGKFCNVDGIRKEEVFTKGYTHIGKPLLEYNQDMFIYHKNIQVNPCTIGTIGHIKALENGSSKTRFWEPDQFLSCIKSLELFLE